MGAALALTPPIVSARASCGKNAKMFIKSKKYFTD